ncbi:uncharacterized protein [Euwallacea fornicatus]|uniref:uncharacterized protein isoform X2 n=1 Tax=Euwallacea fornicatus TaxID=995702 RepID=UPI0033900C56
MERMPARAEMVKCVKEANLDDADLPDHLLKQYYKVIKNSVTSHQKEGSVQTEKSVNDSAIELQEAINKSESIAPSSKRKKCLPAVDENSLEAFSQDFLATTVKQKLLREESNNNERDTGGKAVHSEADKIDYNKMPKCEDVPLKVMYYEPRFVNIQNSKDYLMASSTERIKMWYEHHVAVAKLHKYYSRLSLNMAPKCKPIKIMEQIPAFDPSLREEESMGTETYVSRSGRLTKRKVYNECDDASSEGWEHMQGGSKRSKILDNDWVSSKNKTIAKEKKLATLKRNDSTVNNNNWLEKSGRSESPDSSHTEPVVPFRGKLSGVNSPLVTPKTYRVNRGAKKVLSNEEVMSRSSLFQDTPKRSRAASLVAAGLQEAEKLKKKKKEIYDFKDSLTSDSQSIEEDLCEEIINVDEERRRVVPPIPAARRAIRPSKKKAVEPLSINTKRLDESAGSSRLANGARTNAKGRALNNNNNNGGKSEAMSSFKEDLDMPICPLCSQSFPQKDIEEHASTCGEDLFPQTAQSKRIACEVCDKVIAFNTDYEVHVKRCTSKRAEY